jgi:hypothetical protein
MSTSDIKGVLVVIWLEMLLLGLIGAAFWEIARWARSRMDVEEHPVRAIYRLPLWIAYLVLIAVAFTGVVTVAYLAWVIIHEAILH